MIGTIGIANILLARSDWSRSTSDIREKMLAKRGKRSDTVYFCGSSSVDRALAFQAKGREFEPRLPL